MVKRLFIMALITGMLLSSVIIGAQAQAFPSRPIRIVNYVAPGGLMDVTTRKYVSIAAKYTNATFVVENKSGAGGLIGKEYALGLPADGYTWFGATKSSTVQVVASQESVDKFVWGFDWVSMLMLDPQGVVVNSKSPINTWDKLIADAKAKRGRQIWVGPATGGYKHLVAMKIWDKAGITANWVPYESGPAAMAALLGGQGVAHSGSPADIVGRPDLKLVAIAGTERMKEFPDVPTFKELGIEGMEDEAMWRGFAVKKGTPVQAIRWLQDLTDKVYADPEWQEFWRERYIIPVNWREDKFTALVKKDIEEAFLYFRQFGIIK